ITQHTTSTPAFRAVTKQRFSDFVVHEIGLDKRTVHLTSLPQPLTTPSTPPELSKEGEEALREVLGEEVASRAIALHAQLKEGGGRGERAAKRRKGRMEAEAEGVREGEKEGCGKGKGEGEGGSIECAGGEEATEGAGLVPGVGAGRGKEVITEVVCGREEDKQVRRAQHQAVRLHLPGVCSDTLHLPEGGTCVRLQLQRDFRANARREWEEGREGRAGGEGGGGDEGGKATGGGGGARGGGVGGKRRRRDDRQEWPAEAGENRFLSFTLYKENRDTIDAVGQLAHSILVGDLRYVPDALRLGQHAGNRFTIVLRDVSANEPTLAEAVAELDRFGFVNYFGLQRFGSCAQAATHHVGAMLLRGDFRGAVEMLLAVREGEGEEERAGREVWASTGDPAAALSVLPRKMNVERLLLEGLRQQRANYLYAYQRLPRALRMMYLHAFQSYLWNHAASERVSQYGVERVVEGDLVLPDGADVADVTDEPEELGLGGEATLEGGGGEGGGDDQEVAAGVGQLEAHVVTREEAEAGVYSIRDVVLPLVGHRAPLPTNEVAEVYHSLLKEHKITPDAFRSKHGLNMSGGLRKLIVHPRELEYKVFRYNDHTVPLCQTDLAELRGAPDPVGDPSGKWVACRLQFVLPPSAYATMCLRELTKQPTDLAHQQMLNTNSLGNPTVDPSSSQSVAIVPEEAAKASSE
ncbi:MAG: hypothetical protein SGPRY_006897, partial [Prymnesium sp.]